MAKRDGKLRALVCEDDRSHFDRLSAYLRGHGYASVLRVESEGQLIRRLRDAQLARTWFDIVLLDLDLSLSGEQKTGAELYSIVSRQFPNEYYVVYTTQNVENFRRTLTDLSFRHVRVLLFDELLSRNNLDTLMGSAIESTEPNSIFLVHGRNMKKKDALQSLLEHGFGLHVTGWEEARERVTTTLRNYIFEIVLKGIEESHATIVLFTGDERVRVKSSLTSRRDHDNGLRFQSRANVLIEAGYAIAARPGRTVLL